MDIIFTLTIRHLKQNQKRTAATLLGIMAASALLTLSVLFVHSFIKRISDFDAVQADVKKLILAASAMLAVILAVLTLFIYHMLSLSASEKIRQLGILGSIGATPLQRGKITLYEALIISVIGLPAGLFAGIIISCLTFPFSVKISWGVLLGLLAFEMLVIIITGLIHTFLSSRGSVLQLILNRTEKRDLKCAVHLPDKIQKVLSLEAQFAIKNIYYFRKRYFLIGVSFFLSAILFLDGFIYLNYQSGNYEPKDQRTKHYADLTVEEEAVKRHENWLDFAQEIAALPEVEEAVLREKIELGSVLFQPEDAAKGMDSFTVYDIGHPYQNPLTITDRNNQEEKGIYLPVILTGLDDKAFEQYCRQVGVSGNQNPDKGAIPVVIEDTILLKNGKNTEYQEFLEIEPDALCSIIADKGRGVPEDTTDVSAADTDEYGIEFVQYQFQAIAVTAQMPHCSNIEDGLTEGTNAVHFYTSQYYFEQFFNTYDLNNMRDKTTRSVSLKLKNDITLPDHILYPAFIQKGSYEWYSELKAMPEFLNTKRGDELQKILKQYNGPIADYSNKIRDVGVKYGFSDDRKLDLMDDNNWDQMDYYISSYPAWIESVLTDPFPVFRQLFAYTLFIFISIISAFQMIQMMISAAYMRKREFAVMLSLGTSRHKIQKIVCMESLICLIFSFAAGGTASIIIGHLMFSKWSETQFLEITFPYHLLAVQFSFLLILIVISIYVSMRNIRKIHIMDILKEEF